MQDKDVDKWINLFYKSKIFFLDLKNEIKNFFKAKFSKLIKIILKNNIYNFKIII